MTTTPPMPGILVEQPYLCLLIEYAHLHQHKHLQRFLEHIGGLTSGMYEIRQEELAFGAIILSSWHAPFRFPTDMCWCSHL